MSTHAPGPWSLRDGGGFQDVTGRRVEHSSCWIMGAWSDREATDKSLANDHLIAAAPEMLAALEQVVSVLDSPTYRAWVERVSLVDAGLLCEDFPRVDMAGARAAIAKAKVQT